MMKILKANFHNVHSCWQKPAGGGQGAVRGKLLAREGPRAQTASSGERFKPQCSLARTHLLVEDASCWFFWKYSEGELDVW